MRITLCALNAKYIHSALALRYLEQVLRRASYPVQTLEFTINEPPGTILSELYLTRPDVVGFSCYIWNIEMVLRLCFELKTILPDVIVVLGGPEVCFDPDAILAQHPSVDYILSGEGEISLVALLNNIEQGRFSPDIPGLWSRYGDHISAGPPPAYIEPLDSIPFPYPEGLPDKYKRIVYYETSRGCPYRCSYCVSAGETRVRYLSLARVKRDLALLMQARPAEIKFVDRTFNCNEVRAREIMEYLLMISDDNTRFHFEICADLLSEDMLAFLSQVPAGRFDLEIGVQSTHDATLKAIERRHDWPQLSRKVAMLSRNGNLHLHLDLIAGLPEEDLTAFARSFNDVYQLEPDQLQLGFLKFLKGTPIRSQAAHCGYRYQANPPYQVLSSRWLGYNDLVKLSYVEDVVEKYYNSGLARHTLSALIEHVCMGNAFSLYADFGEFWHAGGWFGMGTSLEERLRILHLYVEKQAPPDTVYYFDRIKYDFLASCRSFQLPPWMAGHPACADILASLLKRPGFVGKFLPEMMGMTVKNMKKRLILEIFRYRPDQAPGLENQCAVLFVYPEHGREAGRIVDISQDCNLN